MAAHRRRIHARRAARIVRRAAAKSRTCHGAHAGAGRRRLRRAGGRRAVAGGGRLEPQVRRIDVELTAELLEAPRCKCVKRTGLLCHDPVLLERAQDREARALNSIARRTGRQDTIVRG